MQAFTFIDELIIHTDQVLNKDKITARSLVNRHRHDSAKFDRDLIYHICNDTYNDWLEYKHKLRADDVLISTDSSRDTNTGLAGLGVFINDYNKLHYFHQPFGRRSNQYGEH